MTKSQRNYFSVLSVVSIFVMVLTILFGSGKSLSSPLTVRGSNQVVEGSITWTTSNSTKTSHSSYNKSFSIKTSRGTDVHLFSTGYWQPTNPQLIDTKTGGSDYGLFVTSELGNKEALFSFQYITKVVVITGSNTVYSAGFDIYAHGTDVSADVEQRSLGPSRTFTYTTGVLGGTSLVIKPANTYELDITSLTVEYSCVPGGVPAEKSLSSIAVNGQTTNFRVGDTFSFGGTVTAHYTDFSSTDVTSSATFSGYNMSSVGLQTVTVSYTESGVTETTTYSITVADVPTGIDLTGTYNFSSRSSYTTPVWINKMWIVFTSDTAGYWKSTRSAYSGLVKYNYDCRVYFDYEVEEVSGSYSVSMSMTSYEFRRFRDDTGEEDTVTTPAANWFSGYSYDRPVDNDFTAASAYNNTGVVTSNKATLTISVFERKTSPVRYEVYDTFTFTLAS